MVSFCGYGLGVWSTGGSLASARWSIAGAGTQNAGLAIGGIYGNTSVCSCTEEYNGTSWSSGGALITARSGLSGAGTQNEGLAIGGRGVANTYLTLDCTEEYNGTSWSVGGALSLARYNLAGAGTQNAGLAAGGSAGPSCTEEYNGTSWSVGGVLINPNLCSVGLGIQNNAMIINRQGGLRGHTVQLYNGTSWSTLPRLLFCRGQGLESAAGQSNMALAFGGSDNAGQFCVLGATEEYDGVTWSSAPDKINITIYRQGGLGSQNAALSFGGQCQSGLSVGTTFEYTKPFTIVDAYL
jgi:hypothetical protein